MVLAAVELSERLKRKVALLVMSPETEPAAPPLPIWRTPAERRVLPENVLLPERISVPLPDLVRPPVPLIAPLIRPAAEASATLSPRPFSKVTLPDKVAVPPELANSMVRDPETPEELVSALTVIVRLKVPLVETRRTALLALMPLPPPAPPPISMAPAAKDPPANSVMPLSSRREPVKPFAPERVSVPPPCLTMPRRPLIAPLKV